jgi:hypothetical protein
MGKVSRKTADNHWSAPGVFDSAASEVDGYSVEIESWDVDMDFAFAFKGLPDDRCPASHFGYLLKGKFTLRMADGSEEVVEAGDAFVLKPGHIPSVAAGTEWVIFTPIEEAKAMSEVMQANMMKYAAEHGIQVQG